MPASHLRTAPTGSSARELHSATIGCWRLIRLLGEGESSQVYQASPLEATSVSAANYAVKVLKTSHQNMPEAIEQLQHEAFVGRSVSHPHLQSILAAHVDRFPFYLVMPYQPGATIRQRMCQSSRLPTAVALWIARQLAEGLEVLHDHGWIHGDLKPENVYVAENGHTTLCDFGLSRSQDRSPRLQRVLTGTPAYMPPEAFCGTSDVAPARDSYSLGVVLFEMLTGQHPFGHSDAAELAAAHRILRPPDPRSLYPEIPASVARLLRRLLAKEPLRRPTGPELVQWLVDLEIDSFEARERL